MFIYQQKTVTCRKHNNLIKQLHLIGSLFMVFNLYKQYNFSSIRGYRVVLCHEWLSDNIIV